MALQQHRIVRFLMILAAVLLTIFIYASYSTLKMTIPTTRLHQQATLISSSSSSVSLSLSQSSSNPYYHNINNNNNNDESSGSNNIFIIADKQNLNLEKYQYNSGQENNNNHTLDDNNISNNVITVTNSSILNRKSNNNNLSNTDLSKKSVISTTISYNSSVFSSSMQTLNRTNITIASNNNNNINNNSISLSSLQTVSSVQQQQGLDPSVAAAASLPIKAPSQTQLSSSLTSSSTSSIQQQQQQQQQQQKQKQKQQQHQKVPPSSSQTSSISTSAIMTIDTSKGIPTASIYESGHLEVNSQLCNDEGESLRLFIVITSAPTHREARLAIRQTWGHYGVRRDVSISFILGRTTNQAIEDALSAENYMYGDLIRGRFIDSYNNLTLKTISALEWINKNCPQANYVLKTDDDMFVNVPKLLSFIDKHSTDKRTIFGRLAKKWKPIRNKKSKYYVSPGQFSLTVFPQFTTGPAYLLSSDIINDLYIKSLEQTYLKLEDVYTTGIVAQLLNIKRVHVNEFLNRRIAFNPCNIRKAISVHMIKSNEQFDLWKKLLDTTTKCK